jgi:hypothetical protein
MTLDGTLDGSSKRGQNSLSVFALAGARVVLPPFDRTPGYLT